MEIEGLGLGKDFKLYLVADGRRGRAGDWAKTLPLLSWVMEHPGLDRDFRPVTGETLKLI
jgi:hypothetical protein